MAKLSLLAGTTSKRLYVFIQDSSQTDGRGLTGLAFNTGSLVASYVLPGAARVAITLATQTVTGAYSSGGFVEVDATNMPGVYRFDPPNAALAASNASVLIMLKGAANMAPCLMEVELTAIDNQAATNGGMSVLTTIQADTDDMQTRLPAALVSGRIDASVGAMANNVLTAAAIQADAITAAKVADGTIDSATFAAGAINAAAIATDAITAAKIAADAIGASELAADAVTEIQSGLATSASIVTAQADLDDIQTRLPAALVSGRIDASVGAMAADTLTAAALAADAGTEIGTAVWATATRALTDKANFSLSAAGIQAIWDALTSALTTAGSIGKLLVDNINATISSRLASASYTAPDNTSITAIKAKTDNLPASPAAVGSAMTLDLTQAIANGPTIGTVGYALVAGESQGAGDWTLVGTTLTLKRRNGSTFITFTVDSATDPTQRISP